MTNREKDAILAGIRALKRTLIDGLHMDRVDKEEGVVKGVTSSRCRKVLRIVMDKHLIPGKRTQTAHRQNPDLVMPYVLIYEKELLGIPLTEEELALAYPEFVVKPEPEVRTYFEGIRLDTFEFLSVAECSPRALMEQALDIADGLAKNLKIWLDTHKES